MSMQETVDAIAMHFLVHLPFKGLLDLLDRGNLSPFGSGEKGVEEGLFLLEGQIFMIASAFCSVLDDCWSQPIVPRDDPMHRGRCDYGVQRNLVGFARRHQ